MNGSYYKINFFLFLAGGPKITKEDEGEEPQVPEDFTYDESQL